MQFDSWAGTDIGHVRRSNQDSVGCFPDLGLFIVADGMGGHANGEVASRMAVELVHEEVERRIGAGQGDDVDLPSAIRGANQQIFAAGRSGDASHLPAMGTTIVSLHLGVRAAWGHAGDSRLYRYRDGRLELLTADDTRFGRQVPPGESVPLDLTHTNELLSALGVDREVSVTLGTDEARAGDIFCLCSDGVSGLISPRALEAELAAMTDTAATGQRLIDLALQAGGTDNASVVVVRLTA